MSIVIADLGRTPGGREAVATVADGLTFDWTNVRPVYRSLHAEFWRLTTPFGIKLSPDLLMDLAHLIAAMDAVDRELDNLPDQPSRERFSDNVTSFLAGKTVWQHLPQSALDLEQRLLELRNVIVRKQIQTRFAKTVQSIFSLSEEKRNICDVAKFMKLVRREWRMAGELTILILAQKSAARFEAFFLNLCEAMHAVDTALDARNDYRRGLVCLRPGLVFYLTLFVQFAKHVSIAFINFPARTHLVRYAIAVLGGSNRSETVRDCQNSPNLRADRI